MKGTKGLAYASLIAGAIISISLAQSACAAPPLRTAEIELQDPETPPSEDQAPGAKKKKKEPEILTARAYLSVDRFPAGDTCEIILLLKIADGWHINTNPPRPDFVIPTSFTLKSKFQTKLVEVKYPKGKEFKLPGLDEPLHVYEQQVALWGKLAVPLDAAGRNEQIQLEVSYQPCNDQRCLAKKTLRLNGRVRVAGVGETVKKINENLFQQFSQTSEQKSPAP